MKTFATKQEATEHLNSTYADYAGTGVANVVKAGPQIAKFLGCEEGYYIDIEREA